MPQENSLNFNANDWTFVKFFCAQPSTDFELYNQFVINHKVLLKWLQKKIIQKQRKSILVNHSSMKTFSYPPVPWYSKRLFNCHFSFYYFCRMQFLTSTQLAREQTRKPSSDPVPVLDQAPVWKVQITCIPHSKGIHTTTAHALLPKAALCKHCCQPTHRHGLTGFCGKPVFIH